MTIGTGIALFGMWTSIAFMANTVAKHNNSDINTPVIFCVFMIIGAVTTALVVL